MGKRLTKSRSKHIGVRSPSSKQSYKQYRVSRYNGSKALRCARARKSVKHKGTVTNVDSSTLWYLPVSIIGLIATLLIPVLPEDMLYYGPGMLFCVGGHWLLRKVENFND